MPEAGFSPTPLLETLLARRDLTPADARAFMLAVVEGRVPPASMAAVAVALRAKGESEHEIAAFAGVLREQAVAIQAPEGTLDTCGTGGDKSETFNISTCTALVVAGMGIPVAKHGNRSVSSKSGSSEVLKALGVNIEAPAPLVERCIREAGIGFLFAAMLHPGMKHAGPVRRELGIRTVFNLLGPLSNPARARRQLLGVFEPRLCELFARVQKNLGSESAMIVCGAGAGSGYLDEISTFGPTSLARLNHGTVSMESFDAATLGFARPEPAALAAKDPDDSARIVHAVLDGTPGPAREIVLVNASAAAQVAGRAASWQEGVDLAAQAIDQGRARAALAKLAQLSSSGG
ncbi:MAG: anthranilate phosphoribosyltransferase [Planctomycetota bacterium]|nr:anthranilate phosphoribosyltransferase [Planctomycetota bacterium]